MDLLVTVGLWNQVLALRHCERPRVPGHMRDFASAVPMISQAIIQGERHGQPPGVDNYHMFSDALLFHAIVQSFRLNCPRTSELLQAIVQRFPGALMQQDMLQGSTPLHVALSCPMLVDGIAALLPPDEHDFHARLLITQDNSGQTPLNVALRHGAAQRVVEQLVDDLEQVLTLRCNELLTPVQLLALRCRETLHTELFAAIHMSGYGRHPAMALLNVDTNGETALHVALRNTDYRGMAGLINQLIPDLIDPEQRVLLVRNQRNVSTTQRLGEAVWEQDTPLHMALKKGLALDTLVLLVDNNHFEVLLMRNTVNLQNVMKRDTPLHLAIKGARHVDVVRAMVDPAGRVLLVACANRDLPLHTALRNYRQHGHADRELCPETVQFLVDTALHAHIDCFTRTGQHGDTALHIACKNTAPQEVLVLLIQADARMLLVQNAMSLEAVDAHKQRDTPLHIALRQQRSLEVVQLLVAGIGRGALQLQNTFGNTPLHLAVLLRAPFAIVDYLVKADPSVLLVTNAATGPDEPGILQADEAGGEATPLDLALGLRPTRASPLGDITPLLIDEDRAVLLLQNSDGTPLHKALDAGRHMELSIIQQLVDADRRVFETVNSTNNSPLHVAVYTDVDISLPHIQFVLATAAGSSCSQDIRTRTNDDGETALHVLLEWTSAGHSLTSSQLYHLVQSLVDTEQTVLATADNLGMLPLHTALTDSMWWYLADNNIIELLLPSDPAARQVVLLHENTARQTAFSLAVEAGCGVGVLAQLVDTEKRVLSMRGSAGLTPLHVRANMSNATVDGAPFGDVIEFILLEAGKLSVESGAAGALLSIQDSAGSTPLHHAIVVKAPYSILQLLIDTAGKTLSIAGTHGACEHKTPLSVYLSTSPFADHMNGTELENTEFANTVALLIDQKRQVLLMPNPMPKFGGSLPIHDAMSYGCSLQVLELLIPPLHTTPPPSRFDAADGDEAAVAAYLTALRGPGYTPLLFAMQKKMDPDVIQLLSNKYRLPPSKGLHDRMLRERDAQGKTALYLAVEHRKTTTAMMQLIDSEQQVLSMAPQIGQGCVGDVPLQVALKQSQAGACGHGVNELLIDGARRVLLHQNSSGQTALHTALHHSANPVFIMHMLAVHACSVPQLDDALVLQDDLGNTPLHLALALGIPRPRPGSSDEHEEISVGLWSDIKHRLVDTHKRVLLIANKNGDCPLHQALETTSMYGMLSTATVQTAHLIDLQQDVLCRSDCNDATPLHLAVHLGCVDVALLLLLADARESVFTRQDVHGATPLHTALELGHTDLHLLTFLSGTGQQQLWHVKNSRGHTPLCSALYNGAHLGTVRFLLSSVRSDDDKQMALLAIDRHKRTPLHIALRRGAAPCIVELLLQEQHKLYTMFDDRLDMPLHLVLRGHDSSGGGSSSSSTTARTLQSCLDADFQRFIGPGEVTLLWQNEDGNTALHLALLHMPKSATPGYVQQLHRLVDREKIVYTLRNRQGHTPCEAIQCRPDISREDCNRILGILGR